jgi:hypothetical protein
MLKVPHYHGVKSTDSLPPGVKPDALQAELDKVNGKAHEHTFCVWHDLVGLANVAEHRLEGLGIPKASRAGAEFHATSGKALPNAYSRHGHTVIRTGVHLRRRSEAWFLVSAVRRNDWPTERPRETLVLTPEQDAIAVAKLRESYSIRDRHTFIGEDK